MLDYTCGGAWAPVWLHDPHLKAEGVVIRSVDVMLEDYKRDVSQLGRLKYQCKTL